MQLVKDRKRAKRRLSAAEEERIGREIVREEACARAAISAVDVAKKMLDEVPQGQERTRAGATKRLRAAIDAAKSLSEGDESLRSRVQEARQAWARAEALRWQLALSGHQIVQGEARKFMHSQMRYEDLVQEGYIGLIRAAKRFERIIVRPTFT